MLKRIFFVSFFLCDALFACDNLIPRDVLLARSEVCAASMNKSGSKIAYISGSGRDVFLRIADINGKTIKKFPIKASRNMWNYVWSFDDKFILIPQDENGDENDHIICLNVITGEKKDLTPYKNSKSAISKLSEKFPHEIIVSCNKRNPMWFDEYRINIETGETKLIFENNEFSEFTFDSDLNLRIAGKVTQDGSVESYAVINGKKGELLSRTSFEDSFNSRILHFSKDGKTLYVIKSENRDIGALYAYDWNSKKLKLIFESSKAEFGGVLCDPATYAPQIVSVEYLKPKLLAIDKRFESDIEFLEKSKRIKMAAILGRSRNDNVWLISYYSTTKSPEYCVYDRKHRTLRHLFSGKPQLDKYALQPMEPVIITARDGLEMPCYLTKARNFKPGSPLVMYIHGGPWARDCLCLNNVVQLLANRGYSVLQVNYRGSLGFGKKHLLAINKNLSKARDDIIDAANWAVANKIAGKDNIAIMGGSFGGYLTLAGLAYTPDAFCCGVDIVGISNWLTLFKSVPQYWLPSMISWYKTAGDPRTEEGRKELWENSPLSRANEITRPLLALQGEHDPRVNKRESDQIVSALKKKNIPVVYVLYPDEGHGFLKEPNIKSSIAISEKFLSRFLGGWFEPIGERELDGSSHKILEGKIFL